MFQCGLREKKSGLEIPVVDGIAEFVLASRSQEYHLLVDEHAGPGPEQELLVFLAGPVELVRPSSAVAHLDVAVVPLAAFA